MLRKLICDLVQLLTVAFIMLGVVYYVASNPAFYYSQYEKNNTAEVVGMSEADLKMVTENIIDYITGPRENLDMQATINGEYVEVFNEREKAHMVDVEQLFDLLGYVIALLFFATIGIFSWLTRKDQTSVVNQVVGKLYLTILATYAIVAFLFWLAAQDFTLFWELFHQGIFTNDLYKLDPATSVMINMFPESFFYAICFEIVENFTIVCILPILVSLYVQLEIKYKKKNFIADKDQSENNEN